MKQHAKVLLSVLALLLGGIIMNAMTPAAASARADTPVTVTNTPLPIAGTINANVSGNVGVKNFPGSMAVTNPTDGSGNPVPLLTVSAPPTRTLVTLQCTDNIVGPCSSTMTRINPDGSRSAFSIPSAQTLVVTDLRWSVTGCNAGFNCTIELAVHQSNQDVPVLVFGSLADPGGGALGSEHLTSGFVFSGVPTIITNPSRQTVVTMTGYLAPAQ